MDTLFLLRSDRGETGTFLLFATRAPIPLSTTLHWTVHLVSFHSQSAMMTFPRAMTFHAPLPHCSSMRRSISAQ